MKKLILATVITSVLCVSTSAFAISLQNRDDPAADTVDSASAKITWVAEIPVIIAGQYITFTGEGGQPSIKEGKLNILANGEFSSEPIKLELRYYDAKTGNVEGGVIVGDNAAGDAAMPESITYTVSNVVMTSTYGVELSNVNATISMNEVEMFPNVPVVVSDTNSWETLWTISNATTSAIPVVIPGDQILASTVVYADVSFVAASHDDDDDDDDQPLR